MCKLFRQSLNISLLFKIRYQYAHRILQHMSTGQHILVWSRFIAQCIYATSNDIYTTEGNKYQRIKIVLLCFVGIYSWMENIIYWHLALNETNDSRLKHWILSLSSRVMPIWGGHEWGIAGDKRNCCCNLYIYIYIYISVCVSEAWCSSQWTKT